MCACDRCAYSEGRGRVEEEVRRVLKLSPSRELPSTSQELARYGFTDAQHTPSHHTHPHRRLFTTCYMGSTNSSHETKQRAGSLARQIGANHKEVNIDDVVEANLDVFAQV